MKKYSPIRFLKRLLVCFIQNSYLPSNLRPKLLSIAGAKIGRNCFIGECCIFDSMHPENIELKDGATITMRCTILTHYMQPYGEDGRNYEIGKVIIGKRAFIGAHTVICNAVTIGDEAVVAAGSIVTHDIPPGEIWGGCPAKFIRRRDSVKTIEECHERYIQKH